MIRDCRVWSHTKIPPCSNTLKHLVELHGMRHALRTQRPCEEISLHLRGRDVMNVE